MRPLSRCNFHFTRLAGHVFEIPVILHRVAENSPHKHHSGSGLVLMCRKVHSNPSFDYLRSCLLRRTKHFNFSLWHSTVRNNDKFTTCAGQLHECDGRCDMITAAILSRGGADRQPIVVVVLVCLFVSSCCCPIPDQAQDERGDNNTTVLVIVQSMIQISSASYNLRDLLLWMGYSAEMVSHLWTFWHRIRERCKRNWNKKCFAIKPHTITWFWEKNSIILTMATQGLAACLGTLHRARCTTANRQKPRETNSAIVAADFVRASMLHSRFSHQVKLRQAKLKSIIYTWFDRPCSTDIIFGRKINFAPYKTEKRE